MNNKKRLFKRPSLLSFVFLFFIISTSFLVIGYSANSSTLAIDGSLVTRSNLDVRITDIKLNSSGLQLASQTVTPGYTAKSIDGGVRLTSASSYVTYDVTVTNLSSQNVLVTDIASTQWTNTNMEYVLENLTINETIIPAASEYTFQVKIKFKDKKNKEDITEIEENSKINITTDGDNETLSLVKAEDVVAQIGNETYTSLKSAVDAVKTGETIKILSDIYPINTFELTNNNFTIDLNSNKVRSFSSDSLFNNAGELNVIDNSENASGSINSVSSTIFKNTGTLNVKNIGVNSINTINNTGTLI